MHPRRFASTRPDHPAVLDAESGRATTYAELEAQADQGARLLRTLGVRRGDAVALYLVNGRDYLTIFWAAHRCGCHIVPVAARLTAGEAAYVVDDSGARVLLMSPDLPGATQLATMREAMPQLVAAYAVGGVVDGLVSWDQARADMAALPIDDEAAGVHMLYSSGTTGRPKGVRMALPTGPLDAPYPAAIGLSMQWGVGQDSIYLSPMPLYHGAALIWATSVQRLGGTTVIMERFDPEALLRAIERHRVTIVQMVPTMFVRLLKLPEAVRRRYDLSSLQRVVHAAAPCPAPVKRAMIDWLGPIIDEYYSASENLGATGISAEEWLAKPGSVGRATQGRLHICDERGDELPPGEAGLVYFSGGPDFAYHNDAAKTQASRHPQRPALSTVGDIGHVDEDGYLFLTDRRDFMIISGGVNVYPQEVENALVLHPAVMDVAVFGVPHPDLGEAVKAVVQPADWSARGPVLEAELIAWLRQRLSPIKCPKSIDFERELPRHDNGKLFKTALRDRYRTIQACA